MKSKFINFDYYAPGHEDAPEVGSIHFLVSNSHLIKGWERFYLRDHPARTNMSRKIMLHGWCGCWNDLSTSGCGIAKIVRVFKNGRIKMEILTSPEGEAVRVSSKNFEAVSRFLEEVGYEDDIKLIVD